VYKRSSLAGRGRASSYTEPSSCFPKQQGLSSLLPHHVMRAGRETTEPLPFECHACNVSIRSQKVLSSFWKEDLDGTRRVMGRSIHKVASTSENSKGSHWFI